MPKIRLTEQIELNLSGQANNLICVGPVGSGKTQLLYHLLMSLYAQDCVVYAADVDLTSGKKSFEAKLIGHSSPDGTSGKLFTDMSGLTTALHIVKHITINIQ